jgi:hypothetical protein
MLAGVVRTLCFVTMCASTPVFAADVWDCTYTSVPGAGDAAGNLKIRINGNTLQVELPSICNPPGIDCSLLKLMSQFQVLESNEVGIVAGSSQIHKFDNDEVLLAGAVLTINRSTVDLHIGSVTLNGAHDLQRGSCKPE